MPGGRRWAPEGLAAPARHPVPDRATSRRVEAISCAPGEPALELVGVQGVGPARVAGQERYRRQLCGGDRQRLERQRDRGSRGHGVTSRGDLTTGPGPPAANTARHPDRTDANPPHGGNPRARTCRRTRIAGLLPLLTSRGLREVDPVDESRPAWKVGVAVRRWPSPAFRLGDEPRTVSFRTSCGPVS